MQISIPFLIDLVVFIAIVTVSVAITCWLWGYSRYRFDWGHGIIVGIVAALVWIVVRMLPLGRYTLVLAFVAVFVVILLLLRNFWSRFSDVGTAFLGTLVCVVLVIVIWLIISYIISTLGIIAGYLPPLSILPP